MTALVIGLGHPDRGDDAVGPTVARDVRALDLPDVDVVEHDEPLGLLDRWEGYRQVVVVDAVRSGASPGTVHTRDASRAPLPAERLATSSHALDLAGTIELARSLGRLPQRLVLVGVEAADLTVGRGLSPAVQAARPDAVRSVLSLLQAFGTFARSDVPL